MQHCDFDGDSIFQPPHSQANFYEHKGSQAKPHKPKPKPKPAVFTGSPNSLFNSPSHQHKPSQASNPKPKATVRSSRRWIMSNLTLWRILALLFIGFMLGNCFVQIHKPEQARLRGRKPVLQVGNVALLRN
ncbi:hypothetical protein DFH09DRAFT_1108229 [Mycena vulgaris]|nr:hypothetical protein DFH09DRAFT_1108229 [Mycena vulgaris]